MVSKFFITALLLLISGHSHSQSYWKVNSSSNIGPVSQVALSDLNGKKRTVFLAFEYLRKCDPIFSYAEISGSTFGSPMSQTGLKDSKIGIILNGGYHTWHAAKTNYSNGYEAGFGVQNGLLLQLLTNVKTLTYVTPDGENIALPIGNFQQSIQEAIAICRKRVQ